MKSTVIFLFFIVVIVIICKIILRYEIIAFNVQKDRKNIDGIFRVMTFNVNTTSSLKDVDGFKAGLFEEINRHKPDVLCLQELVPEVFKQVQISLDSYFGYTDSMKIKEEPSRFAIYSKYPIRGFTRYKCLSEFDVIEPHSITNKEIDILKSCMPFYSAEIEVEPDKWIRVFAVHLRSSAYSVARRSMDKNASWMDGLPLYYKNYKIGKKIRNWEADNLRLYLDSLEAENTPVIIAGDFNDWNGSCCMKTIQDGKYKDAWWEGGFGFGITYDEWHLKLRLDHILYSHHFKLENVYVEKSKFSDHRPLIADFSLLP